jgi:hypothetical protein
MSKNRQELQDMNPEKAKELKAYLQAIAAILYEETPPEELNTLEEIEQTVRQKVLKHVSPEIGVFLFKQSQGLPLAEQEN